MLLRSNALPHARRPPSCHNSGMGGNTIVWSSGQSQAVAQGQHDEARIP